jgi:hypothetical protein
LSSPSACSKDGRSSRALSSIQRMPSINGRSCSSSGTNVSRWCAMQRAFSRPSSTWLMACRIASVMDTHQDSAGCSCQVGWGANRARELYPLPTDLPRQSHTIALQAVVLQSRPRTRGEGSFIICLVTSCVRVRIQDYFGLIQGWLYEPACNVDQPTTSESGSFVDYLNEAPDRKPGPELRFDILLNDIFVGSDLCSGDLKLCSQRPVVQRVLANDQCIAGPFHRPTRPFVIIR